MFEAWGYINGEWVKGWDVGTLRKMTVFFVGEEKPYADRVYLNDYEVMFSKERPTCTPEDNRLIQQTLEAI